MRFSLQHRLGFLEHSIAQAALKKMQDFYCPDIISINAVISFKKTETGETKYFLNCKILNRSACLLTRDFHWDNSINAWNIISQENQPVIEKNTSP